MDKNDKISESMEGNTNAEKWTEESATKFMNDAVQLSKSKEYDFIGEIAQELDSYKDVFFYLCDKYPSVKRLFNRMKNNCEANCFNNIKKENINTAAGIINLKSNHGWSDRIQTDHTTKGDKIETQFIVGTKEHGDEVKDFVNDIKEDKE